MPDNVSVTILTKDSSKHLAQVLAALVDFKEIVILDNGSSDNTLAIAKQFNNVKIFTQEFIGFGKLKNKAISYCSNEWILSVDADEIVTPKLTAEIAQLNLNEPHKIYSISRHNHYGDTFIKGCGWYPDRIVRLFNKTHTEFKDVMVHEYVSVQPSSKIIKLDAPLLHYSFDNAGQFLTKIQYYSNLYVQENKHKKQSSLAKAIVHAISAFIKSYLFKKGFLYGYKGFVISVSAANGTFYKYIRLLEANQQIEK